MKFSLENALPVLQRTPSVVRAWLFELPEPWVRTNEGPETWSPFDIVGHLVQGEQSDWMQRVEHLLRHGESIPFAPVDRFAQFDASRGKGMAELLDTFAELRAKNLRHLERLALTPADLTRRGRHPAFGSVTLEQHLSTWVAHDLSHMAQIARVMGRQYTEAVGPWRAYLPMLERK